VTLKHTSLLTTHAQRKKQTCGLYDPQRLPEFSQPILRCSVRASPQSGPTHVPFGHCNTSILPTRFQAKHQKFRPYETRMLFENICTYFMANKTKIQDNCANFQNPEILSTDVISDKFVANITLQ
jgi:hypothetical protein